MSLELFVQLFVLIVSVFGGAFVAFYFNSKRDRAVRKREIVTSHLIEAWRSIEIGNPGRQDRDPRQISIGLSNVMLFGTDEMIDYSLENFKEGKSANATPLSIMLRDHIRKELDLSKIPGDKYGWFVAG